MNFKKFVSTISAVAIAASAFAGMVVTASAQAEITLNHTFSLSCDKSLVWASALDTEKAHYNAEGSGSWQGYAFADFSISVPEDEVITEATLTWSMNQGGTKARDTSLYYLSLGKRPTYEETSGGRYNAEKTLISTMNLTVGDHLDNTTNVTDAVKTLYGAGQNYIVFQWTNNAGGADLYGMASANKPTLTVKTEAASAMAEYTVKYVDEEGNSIKADDSRDAIAGSTIALTSDDTADFTVNDKKYIYKSSDVEGKTVASDGSTVVTVTYRVADMYSYSVYTNTGRTLAEGSAYEGNTITTKYPFYINVDGTLYSKGATSNQYKDSFVLTENNQKRELEYNKSDITNVVYHSEAEDVEGLTITTTGNIDVRSSQAAAAYAAKDTVLVKLDPGKYIVNGVVFSGSTAGAHLKFSVGTNEFGFDVENASNWTACKSDEIIVASTSDLVFLTSGANNAALDYIYVVKTGDYVAPSATKVNEVTGADYTTSDGVYAKAMEFRADANDGSFSKIIVTVEGSKERTQEIPTVEINGGTAVFGIILASTDSSKIPGASAIQIDLQ